MRGFQRGPHCGSRILDTTHLDLRLSVTQLGGMIKFRYVPRSHKSERLGWHFSWTVHWHQQQRRPEWSEPVPQSSSQTWQVDSTWIFPWKSILFKFAYANEYVFWEASFTFDPVVSHWNGIEDYGLALQPTICSLQAAMIAGDSTRVTQHTFTENNMLTDAAVQCLK